MPTASSATAPAAANRFPAVVAAQARQAPQHAAGAAFVQRFIAGMSRYTHARIVRRAYRRKLEFAQTRGPSGGGPLVTIAGEPAAQVGALWLRTFGRLKQECALLPLRVRGIDRVRLHADLT